MYLVMYTYTMGKGGRNYTRFTRLEDAEEFYDMLLHAGKYYIVIDVVLYKEVKYDHSSTERG